MASIRTSNSRSHSYLTLRTPDHNDALISQNLFLETAVRQLCIQYFPRQISHDRPHCSALVSMTARMRNARRLFSKAIPCTLQAMFQCWRTKDCLLIISDHCQQIRDLCQGHHKDAAPKGLWGGLQVSLDLEKAFDAVSRNHVLKALEVFDMNPDLRNLITSWFMPHEYCLPHKELLGRIPASRGIKQGAKDAPLMWIVCIYLFCHELLTNHDME